MPNVPWCHDCNRPDGLCECEPVSTGNNSGSFVDGNNRTVVPLDVVEYEFGARRGILFEIFQDGDAQVLFRDTKACETVKFVRLCKVPAIDEI